MKFKRSFPAFVLAGLLPVCAAQAGPAADDLGACLVHSVDHDDRVVMNRFFFSAYAENPDVSGLANISPEKQNKINADMRALVSRLIRHDCRPEAAHAVHGEGPDAARNMVLAMMGSIGKNMAHSTAVQRELNGLRHGAVQDALDDVGHDGPPPPPMHGPGAPPPPPFP